jgi:type I restriction modification DNA specificity domain protein
MIMAKFKRYDSYKNSGVEWLGEIPSHWEILANKYIFKLKRNLVGKRSNKYVLLSLTLDGIVKRDLDKGGKFPVEFDTYQEVKNGDFVFCLFDVEETPRTIGLSEYDGMITGAYTVFDARNISKKYLYYFYLNLDNNKRLKPLYLGLRNTISKENFFSFKSFIPPKDEQEKIASYLDEKIAKIDTAISGKEKLIELLKEQKQIIINDAVTKGLNKNAKFKNSGVEWLGEIPSHWDIAKVSRFYQITIGKMLQPLKINFKDTLQDYICAANLGNNVLKIDNLKQMWFSETEHKLYKLKKGDLVVVEGGDIGSCDIIKFNTKDLFFQNSIHRVRAKKDNNVKFLRYWLINLKKIGYIDLICNKATIPHFTKEKFEDLICILPPKDEQEKIVEYIENKISKIDKLVNLEQECIKSLKEYKASLIDSVVTGKVKV